MRLFIDGRWIDGADGSVEVTNPYDGSTVGTFARADAAQVDAAIEAAHRALRTGLAPHRRADVLDAVRDIVTRRALDFAECLSREAGKPIRTARAEVERARTTLRLAADEARRLPGEAVPLDGFASGSGLIALTLPEPLGVVGAITPFNFPLNLVLHKVAPAIAAGCPVVLKPSERTPLTAGLMTEAFEEAGLPAGWLNLVTGDPGMIVGRLQDDERVGVLSFTGSSAAGWGIKAASPRKHHILELGSNAALVVDETADVDLAVDAAVSGGFSYSGQTCVSVQRLFVHKAVRDAFLDKFARRVEALVTGDPADEATDVGPLVSPDAKTRVKRWLDDAVEAGARVVTGNTFDDGGLLRPTVITDVPVASPLRCEEVFGPVVIVVPVKDAEEGLAAANDSRFGLNTSIFTNDFAHAIDFARRAETGTVLVNVSPSYRSDAMPYGGVKDSGQGREGIRYAVASLVHQKLVVLNAGTRTARAEE
ncbi:aldehyde dehydrogenase family protein [Actinoplanes sp. NPDC051411]|uniref:aldehyde dehydrogenase family protein n=1 Tax=Actinoplanes sp. NPDC051411 TaxID=3155522 RepID=UPI00343E5549